MRRIIQALLLCVAASAEAGVYKWTDANGKVHYSDQPPPAAEAQKVPIRKPEGITAPEVPEEHTSTTRKTKPDDEAIARERARTCEMLRAEQTRLENSPSGNALRNGNERAKRAANIEQNARALKENGC